MIAGTLEVQMLANLARLSSDMQQAKTIVSGAMDKIGAAVGRTKSILAGLGLGISVAGFTALIKGSIDAMDHLNDLSKTTDIAVEKLAGLSLAAKQTGSDLDSTAQSINKLSQNIGKEPEKFRQLGISAKDPLEAFKQLADLFVLLEDPQQRAAVMAQALGKSWAGAAPMLAEGGEKIGEMIEKGQKLSGITKEMAGGADDFNDKLAEFEARSKGFQYALATALLPHLTKAADVMMELRKNTDNGKASIEGLLVPVKVAATGFVALGGAVASAARLALTNFAVFDKLKNLDLKGAWDEFKIGVAESKAILDKTASVVSTIWAKQEEGAKKATDATKVDQKARDAAAARAKQFLKEEKTGAEDADSAYRNLLKSLKEKLAATEDLTEVMRLELALDAMNAKQLATITPLRRQELMDLAKKIDLKKQEKIDNERLIQQQEEIKAFLLEQRQAQAEIKSARDAVVTATEDQIANLEFESKLLTMMNEQREQAVAFRELENKLGKEDPALENLAIRLRVAIAQKQLLEETVEANKVATEEITEFWRQAARNMQDAMADFFFDAMQGKLDELGKNFVRTIDRMVANAAAAHLADALFGKDFTKGGAGIGGLAGWALDQLGIGGLGGRAPVSDAIPNLVGGEEGFARGTDFVPRTGLALVHRGERITPASENADTRRTPIVQNFTINTPDTNGMRLAQRQIMGEFAAAVGG